MFDAIASLFELFLAEGVPSPSTLQRQRMARLGMSAVALATSSAVWVWSNTPTMWNWLAIVTSAIVAGWVLLFSAVDAIKELPAIAWVSVAAAAAASMALLVISLWIV